MNRLPSCLVWGEGLVLVAAPSGIFTYWEIHWYGVLLDLYLLGYLSGDYIPNGNSIGRSWWRPVWGCLPRSLRYPLFRRSRARYIRSSLLSLSIGRSIGRFMARSVDLDFARDLDWEIVREPRSSIERPWQRRVWFGWSCLGFVFWELYHSGDCLGNKEFNHEIGISINHGSSGISTCQ